MTAARDVLFIAVVGALVVVGMVALGLPLPVLLIAGGGTALLLTYWLDRRERAIAAAAGELARDELDDLEDVPHFRYASPFRSAWARAMTTEGDVDEETLDEIAARLTDEPPTSSDASKPWLPDGPVDVPPVPERHRSTEDEPLVEIDLRDEAVEPAPGPVPPQPQQVVDLTEDVPVPPQPQQVVDLTEDVPVAAPDPRAPAEPRTPRDRPGLAGVTVPAVRVGLDGTIEELSPLAEQWFGPITGRHHHDLGVIRPPNRARPFGDDDHPVGRVLAGARVAGESVHVEASGGSSIVVVSGKPVDGGAVVVFRPVGAALTLQSRRIDDADVPGGSVP